MLNSKKKAKLVVGVAFLLLLLVGSSAGYFLSQQSQDIRQQADDSVGGYGCEGFWDGNNCVSTEIIVPEPEEDKKGDRCSAGSCGGGLTCATSPFGNFCVPEEDAGDAEVIELNENEEDFTTFKLCKDHCEGTCEGSICVTPVKEEGEAPTDSLGYNTASECNSKCDTSCTGPNNRYCLNDDVYITENDYNECLKKSSPQDCKIILSHLGEEEPNREEEEGPKSCGGESDCPLGEICFGGSCVAESDDKEEPAPQVEELSDYEKCIASGKTGIECEYEQNNPDEGVIPTPGSLPDHLIPPKFDPNDDLNLTQNLTMRMKLETEYLEALSNCGSNEACKLAITTSLQEAAETGNPGIALFMLKNPGVSIDDAEIFYNQWEDGDIDFLLNAPLIGPDRIADTYNILAGNVGDLSPSERIIGGIGYYADLDEVVGASNRLFYQIGMSPEEAEYYRTHAGARLGDALMVTSVAVGAGDFITGGLGSRGLSEIPGYFSNQAVDLIDPSLRRLPGADDLAGWGTYGNQIDGLVGKSTEVGGFPTMSYRDMNEFTLMKMLEDNGISIEEATGPKSYASIGSNTIYVTPDVDERTLIHEALHGSAAGGQIGLSNNPIQYYKNECITCNLTQEWLIKSDFPEDSKMVLSEKLYAAHNYNSLKLLEDKYLPLNYKSFRETHLPKGATSFESAVNDVWQTVFLRWED